MAVTSIISIQVSARRFKGDRVPRRCTGTYLAGRGWLDISCAVISRLWEYPVQSPELEGKE